MTMKNVIHHIYHFYIYMWSFQEVGVQAMHGQLLILGFLELAISIRSAILCCQASCYKGSRVVRYVHHKGYVMCILRGTLCAYCHKVPLRGFKRGTLCVQHPKIDAVAICGFFLVSMDGLGLLRSIFLPCLEKRNYISIQSPHVHNGAFVLTKTSLG